MGKYDRSIKEFLTELLDKSAPNPFSKEETWNRIHIKMNSTIKRQPRRRISYISGTVIIVLFVLISISPQRVSASFGWFTQLFVQIQGTFTQLMGTTLSKNNEKKQVPAPAINVSTEEIKLEKFTIEEAQSVTTFEIVVPSYLPEGYTFSGVYVQTEGGRKSSHVLIKYINKEGDTIEIRETDTNIQRGYSIGIDNDDTKIKNIDVRGINGSILIFKNGSKKVVINNQNIQVVIDSDLPEKELQQIVSLML